MRCRRAAGVRRSSHSQPTVAMLSRRPFWNTRECRMKALVSVNGGDGGGGGGGSCWRLEGGGPGAGGAVEG